jgi:hypothetical protein
VLHAKGDCPKFVRWDALNEEWAQINHSQSLETLARRGGLDATEIVANVERRRWTNIGYSAAVEAIKPLAVQR